MNGCKALFKSGGKKYHLLKVIALDFDGTLVKSNQIKDQAFDTIFSEWPEHKDVMMEWHLTHNSIDRREKFHYFVEEVLGLNDCKGLIDELTEKFSKLTKQAIIDCPFVEGAKDFLDYIRDRMVIFLVSATPQLDLNEIIEERDLGKYFKELFGAPINKVKVLKKIMKSENVSPDKMFFIGDSPEDGNAANHLGIQFIGIKSDRSLSKKKFPVFSDFNKFQQYAVDQYEL